MQGKVIYTKGTKLSTLHSVLFNKSDCHSVQATPYFSVSPSRLYSDISCIHTIFRHIATNTYIKSSINYFPKEKKTSFSERLVLRASFFFIITVFRNSECILIFIEWTHEFVEVRYENLCSGSTRCIRLKMHKKRRTKP